ncbi:hypothetical protein N1851_010774 [Merluccius polli]|uniref:Uncharacterized protein n=1 Tax=Merluccius polli TaxID=89951 RepID=A0AA47MY76_MERPO|nr:hypothetical protein N1851_010774 [Merluccius polli]
MDELRLRITTNKQIMDCNLLIFTETWLNPPVPDNAINLAERNVFRADRTGRLGQEQRRVKPTVRIVKIWPEGAEAKLQECFKNHDWSKHSSEATLDSHIDITLYTSSVLDYMRSSTDSVTTLKRITTFPNQKPWMNREVRALLKARDIAFRSGDRRAYSSSRANLKMGITEAKHSHKLRIEEHFTNDSDPRRIDASLPEELNLFYGRFDKDNKEVAIKEINSPLCGVNRNCTIPWGLVT